MKIAVEKSTQEAVYMGNLYFSKDGLMGDDFLDSRMNPENCDLIDMISREEYSYETFEYEEVKDENGNAVLNEEGIPTFERKQKTVVVPAYVAPTMPQNFSGRSYRFENGEFVLTGIGVQRENVRNQIERASYISLLTAEVQRKLDEFAQTRGYDNIVSACSYSNSTISQFEQEALYCIQLRDQTWNAFYSIVSAVQLGTRSVPKKYEDIQSELPLMQWP